MLKSGTLNPLNTLPHCILVGFHNNRTPTQRVFINQNSSKSFNIDCGVPQGSYSDLGPILFIIYLGDSTSLRTTYLVSICMQMISGEEKLSCSIFSVVLYSPRITLRVKSVQSSLHQVRKVTAFPPALVLYSARCVSGVKSVQFCLHQVRKS